MDEMPTDQIHKAQTTLSLNEDTNSSYYTVSEMENAFRKFNTSKECVRAALKEQHKSKFTLNDAKIIIRNFIMREVK